jgi:NAD(P)-dependent dehydrogenase (short-subunit alcohol dehydrogenase family)
MTPRQPNLLIVGGTSSLSYGLIEIALREKYNVFITKRELNEDKPGISNISLNLESDDSLKSFNKEISKHHFDRIIFTIGALSGLQHGKTEQALRDYITTYVSNAIQVLEICMARMTDNSSLVFVSSRSANNKSFDPYYSAAKAAVQSFLMSFTNYLPERKKIFILAPSLIEASSMYHSMSESDHDRHRNMGFGKLLSLSDVTSTIWSLGPENLIWKSGDVVEIGNVQK